MVTALTMTYADEAIGITHAATATDIPVAISFRVETVHCAHPTHFERALGAGEPWQDRIRGMRANASTKSHAELDEATELDEGDPSHLGARYAQLAAKLPKLSVLGGWCGTDHRHVSAICEAWSAASSRREGND